MATSTRYRIAHDPRVPGRILIVDHRGEVIDSARSRVVADYELRALEEGRAIVHPHDSLGCRIQVL